MRWLFCEATTPFSLLALSSTSSKILYHCMGRPMRLLTCTNVLALTACQSLSYYYLDSSQVTTTNSHYIDQNIQKSTETTRTGGRHPPGYPCPVKRAASGGGRKTYASFPTTLVSRARARNAEREREEDPHRCHAAGEASRCRRATRLSSVTPGTCHSCRQHRTRTTGHGEHRSPGTRAAANT
jgi:hypothetical protein